MSAWDILQYVLAGWGILLLAVATYFFFELILVVRVVRRTVYRVEWVLDVRNWMSLFRRARSSCKKS